MSYKDQKELLKMLRSPDIETFHLAIAILESRYKPQSVVRFAKYALEGTNYIFTYCLIKGVLKHPNRNTKNNYYSINGGLWQQLSSNYKHTYNVGNFSLKDIAEAIESFGKIK